jgi:hypothetical protein
VGVAVRVCASAEDPVRVSSDFSPIDIFLRDAMYPRFCFSAINHTPLCPDRRLVLRDAAQELSRPC